MNVLILGATSGIGLELARVHAKQGDALFMTGRDSLEMERIVKDIKIRHGEHSVLFTAPFDISDAEQVRPLIGKVQTKLGTPDRVYICCGCRPDFHHPLPTFEQVDAVFETNTVGPIKFASAFYDAMDKGEMSKIVHISSVHALRHGNERPLYTASKAALKSFFDGLAKSPRQNKLSVMTVCAGHVDTSRTFGYENIMFARSPRKVAKSIIKAANAGKNQLYVPGYIRLVLPFEKALLKVANFFRTSKVDAAGKPAL